MCVRARPRVPHATSVRGGGAPAAPARGVCSFAPLALFTLFTAAAWEQLSVLFQHPGLRTGLRGSWRPGHTYTPTPRLFGNSIPGHTTRASPSKCNRQQGGVRTQFYANWAPNVPGESMPQTRGVRPCGHSRARERRGSVNFCSQPAGLAAAADRASRAWLAPATRWRRRRRPAARERCGSAQGRVTVRPLSRHLSRF